MPGPHVHVVLADNRLPNSLHAALRHVGATASFASLPAELRGRARRQADAVILVPPRSTAAGDRRYAALLNRLSAQQRPAIVLNDRPDASASTLPATVTFCSPASSDTIASRLRTIIEMQDLVDRVRTLRQRLRPTSRPAAAPQPVHTFRASHLRIDVLSRAAESVSGDFYEVRTLADGRVCIVIVDACGHGPSAARISAHLRAALPWRQRSAARLTLNNPTETLAAQSDPAAVLECLNQALCSPDQSPDDYAAALCVVADERHATIRLARAGAPFPVLRRADGSRRVLDSLHGLLLGVDAATRYEVQTLKLRPGDGLLLSTDGIDELAFGSAGDEARTRVTRRNLPPGRTKNGPQPPSAARLDRGPQPPQAAFSMTKNEASDESHPPPQQHARTRRTQRHHARRNHTPASALSGEPRTVARAWRSALRLGLDAALTYLRRRHDTLRRLGRQLDDLTTLTLRFEPQPNTATRSA